jgi:hypothetical protein
MTISPIRTLLFSFLIVFLILGGCGGTQSPPTGSASFNLQWETPQIAGKTVGAAADICSDYGIQTITVTFLDGNGVSRASNNWACTAHQGKVTGIPAASNYTVRIEGLLAGSAVGWRGERAGVSIAADFDTPVSSVSMNYIGTSATMKLSTQGTAAAGSIKGLEVTVTLPAGVTLKADAGGIPNTGVVALSGVVPVGASMAAKYTPAIGATSGTVKISIASSTGFGVGEFVTITGDLASRTVPVSSPFALSDFTAFDGNGTALGGVSSTMGLVLQ